MFCHPYSSNISSSSRPLITKENLTVLSWSATLGALLLLPPPGPLSSASQLHGANNNMAMIAFIHIFALLSAANIALAAECSQGCFGPDGRLDPDAVADPQLFLYRASHSCMPMTSGIRSE